MSKLKTSPNNVPLPGQPVRGSTSGRPIMAAMDLMGRRWVLRLTWEMRTKPCGFRELQAACEGLSPSVLSNRLKELQVAGIVEQTDESLWKLTTLGAELKPVILSLIEWADKWAESFGADAD